VGIDGFSYFSLILFSNQNHPRGIFTPWYSEWNWVHHDLVGSRWSILSFFCSILQIIFCLFCFVLAIELYILWFTASEYHFGIFKLFFPNESILSYNKRLYHTCLNNSTLVGDTLFNKSLVILFNLIKLSFHRRKNCWHFLSGDHTYWLL